MAFQDSLDLRTAVIEAVGDASIADTWERIVRLAEARLNRELRTRWQITEAVLPAVGGVAALPADYTEALDLRSGRTVLWPGRSGVTIGQAMGGVSGPLALTYYAKLPTLADSLTATNWLLEQYPDVYLYACAAEAAKVLRDADMASALAALRDQAISEARSDDFMSRYSRARIRIAGVTP